MKSPSENRQDDIGARFATPGNGLFIQSKQSANPIIAIVGRPNVGKSTLFNRLTRSRDALVADCPGVTRDRQYGIAHHRNHLFLIIDTGGLGEERHGSESIPELVEAQAMRAVEEADILLWLVDGRVGVSATDENLAEVFRKQNKRVYLLVNKLEGLDAHASTADFYRLGFDRPWPISARHGEGIAALLNDIAAATGEVNGQKQPGNGQNDSTTISVLGKPNVGKSTLINCILGEDRIVSSDEPGTTRDSICVPFVKGGQHYFLIDTAGVRRRSKIDNPIEKFSVIKSFHAMERADVIVLIIDGHQGVTEQDSRLLGMSRDSGRGLVIAVNKWDSVRPSQKKLVRAQLDRKCRFVDYAETHFISALHRDGIAPLFKTIERIRHCLNKKYSSSDITGMLFQFTEAHPPPIIRGRRTALRYAHLGENNPLKIIIHGSRTEHVPAHYLRYLARSFRQQMGLIGTPVLIKCKPRNRLSEHTTN